MSLYKQTELNKAVTRFDRMGLAVKMHAVGDAAVRAGLDAIESARAQNGFTGPLHDIAHCRFVTAQDISRGRELGATYEISPSMWNPAPMNGDIAASVGQARMKRVWPVRELLDAGVLVIPGADWPVVEQVNPWPAIESLVTRERPGGSAQKLGESQRISLS